MNLFFLSDEVLRNNLRKTLRNHCCDAQDMMRRESLLGKFCGQIIIARLDHHQKTKNVQSAHSRVCKSCLRWRSMG
jgi:hypothetical protein